MTTRLSEHNQWIAIFRGGPRDGELLAVPEPTPTLKVFRPRGPLDARCLDDPDGSEPELIEHDVGTYRLVDADPGLTVFPPRALYAWHGWE